MHDADAPLVRRDDFGVVGLYGAGVHHGVGATHVVGLLADFDGDAEGSQPFGLRAFLTVGTVERRTPRSWSISASTLIPAPPMPMKWVLPSCNTVASGANATLIGRGR